MNDKFLIEFLNNGVNNNFIIKIQKNCRVCFIEDKRYAQKQPIADYFFTLDDLSINALVTLKWASYAYFFFFSLSQKIKEAEVNSPEYNLENIIPEGTNLRYTKKQHSLKIDDHEANIPSLFIQKMNEEYVPPFFHENTKIHFKLCFNVSDYLLTQNCYYPTIFF